MVENGKFMIGSAMFDSLTELVQYYESNPLYRRMKLKYAINEEVLKSIGEVRVQIVGCGFLFTPFLPLHTPSRILTTTPSTTILSTAPSTMRNSCLALCALCTTTPSAGQTR